MDIALQKAHDLGYEEQKLQMKEARINLPMVTEPKSTGKFEGILLFLVDNQR